MTNAAIPGKYVRTLLSNMLQRGASLVDILSACGISLDDHGEPHIPARVSTADYTRIYKAYLQVMHDEHFAFSSRSGHTAGKYRMLCLNLAQCSTLGEGLERTREFYQSFGVASGSFDLQDLKGSTELRLTGTASVASSRQAAVAANLLISIKRTLDHLVGTTIPLDRVYLRGVQPSAPDRYHALFKCQVIFDSDRDALCFASKVLDFPVVHTLESIEALFEQIPGILFSELEVDDGSLTQRIENLLGHDLSRPMPGLEELAARMGLSVGELRRGLSLEGNSYQQLKQDIRTRRACQMLQDTELSLNNIAGQLGFPATSALHRSFRKSTGMTPRQYRSHSRKQRS